jgi:WD40 repeat protein
VCSTGRGTGQTFWPLPEQSPSVVDGYGPILKPVAFSPDSRWLATSWEGNGLRLWPVPGSGRREVRELEVPRTLWTAFAFDPAGRHFFAAGRGSIVMAPLDGGPVRRLEAFSPDAMVFSLTVSPSGRLLAGAVGFGPVEKTLRVWDLETGTMREFPLPVPESPPETAPSEPTGYEGGIHSLFFEGETTLYSAGHGGIRRWDLDTGSQTLVREGPWVWIVPTGDGPQVFARTRRRQRLGKRPHKRSNKNQ